MRECVLVHAFYINYMFYSIAHAIAHAIALCTLRILYAIHHGPCQCDAVAHAIAVFYICVVVNRIVMGNGIEHVVDIAYL